MTHAIENASVNAAGVREISVETAATLVGKVRMIDVREPDEFTGELGHVAHAELVPLATVEQTAQAWPRDQELVMICRSGGRSGRATEALMRMGFTRVVNMVGGMLAYNAAFPGQTTASAPETR
jgi:rhodanese-related sulfurtransferase